MKRFEIQFMSGAFWRVEAATAQAIMAPFAGGSAQVTRGVIDQTEGEPRRVEAWVNPETVEAVWEVE